MTADPLLEILAEAKKLAQRYRVLTGKPLGITGEIAEYEAARILGVELTPARQAGYDATAIRGCQTIRLQIKGRCVPEGIFPTTSRCQVFSLMNERPPMSPHTKAPSGISPASR